MTTELKIGILTDLSEVEEKISQTLAKLHQELRHKFVDGVSDLLLDGRISCVRSHELIGEIIPGVSGTASDALMNICFRVSLGGLDELCASALRTANSDIA